MPPSLILYGRRTAFNVQKVLWALGELGLSFEHRDAGGAAGGLDHPDFLAMNPHGRVPVLLDASLSLWESHSILRYLGAKYGDPTLWPDDPARRSQVDRWLDWSLSSFGPEFIALFWAFYRTPEEQRNARRIEMSRAACDRFFQLLDRELETRAFLAGDEFSLADIPTGTALYRYFQMGLEVPHHTHVDAWYARLRARKPFREHICVPFDDLFARLTF